MSNQSLYLMTLNIPLLLEEPIVDFLLALENDTDFSSFDINAHNHIYEKLSLAEQVTGRKKQMRFQVYVSEAQSNDLIEQLTTYFAGSGIHYWLSPVLKSGEI